LKPFIPHLLSSNPEWSHFKLVRDFFTALGSNFVEKPEYVDCLFSFVENDRPEIIHLSLFTLITYHHFSPDNSYSRYKQKLTNLLNSYNPVLDAFAQGTTLQEKEIYLDMIRKDSEKLIKLIDGQIPKYDPSKDVLKIEF